MRRLNKSFLSFLIIVLSVWIFSALRSQNTETPKFHSIKEYDAFRATRSLNFQSNALFSGAGICSQCHGKDDNQLASVDASGNDINVVDAWAGTMMANSARDPLWRAKVSHEILVNPAHQSELEETCTSCHAPLGKFNADHSGNTYNIATLETDSVGLDGVSCLACHSQKDTLIGLSFSGQLHYDTSKNVFGPYANPFAIMFSQSGYNPVESAHINDAGLCGGCHTLITQTADLAGNLTGDVFVEQATYHEWLNSNFNTDAFPGTGITCQGCHIPRTNDGVRLSIGPPSTLRSPFGKHELAGGNVFMLKLLKDNIAALALYSTPAQFDSVIARTERMLTQQTLDLLLNEDSRTVDTVFYSLELTNKAGHKFPTGYPARRAWVEFVVMDNLGDTIFRTGLHDAIGELQNQDATFEPHYNLINSELQVQIYEMVMGDVLGNPTTVLERGYQPLKDNRLTPEGFSTLHNAYDTCTIAGDALIDPDFNKAGITEGTGKDILHLHIPLAGYTGALNVSARVYYQSVPSRWLQEMFAFNSTEIDNFRNMFNAADQTPVLVEEILSGPLFNSVSEFNFDDQLVIYPNPSSDGRIMTNLPSHEKLNRVNVYDLSGKLVYTLTLPYASPVIDLPLGTGTYIVELETSKFTYRKKLVLIR